MSLADMQWGPTSVQVTVLQARGLRIKGKSGTNDAYALMQVGKEKFQTAVVEKSVAPVWKEEAAFDLPGGGTERCTLHVQVLHRALMGPDKLLGQAVINLLQLTEDKTRNKTEWFKLLDKTGKADKDRGEVLVDIQFWRNNMTASMFDLSTAGKSRSRLGKFKDKVRGKKRESDTASNVVPSFTQVLTDSEEEGKQDAEEDADKVEKKKKQKKSLFSTKSNLQRNMSQSMSVLPAKNSSLSGSQSSGLNMDSSEGKKKFKFLMHKRSGSSDSKDSSSGHPKHGAVEQSNVCINGSHVYCEEQPPRTSRIGSNFSLASLGHGSMEDVPESSTSVDSLRAARQYSPWTEEEEEEEEGELIKEDVSELRREEGERIRRQEKELERLAEKRQREEEKRTEEEKVKREERIKRQEEERAQEMRRQQEERVRREERERLAKEKKRLEEQEEEKVRKEEEERIRRVEEERRQEEREEKRRLEEQRRRREEEERIKLEEETAQEERRHKEVERARRQEERKLVEEKRRMEEEERIEKGRVRKEEEERIRRELEMAEEERRREEEEMLRIQKEKREEKRRLEEQERKRREEEERIRIEEETAQEERRHKEVERARRQEEERKLAEEKRRMEEEERIEKERVRKERIMRELEMAEEERRREERIRIEEEMAQEERIQEEERKLAEEKRKKEEEERIEKERVRKEEQERIRRELAMAEEKRRQEEEEMERIQKEEHEEKRRLEEQERRQEEERIKKEDEEKARREKEDYEKLVEKIKLEEEERKKIEAEKIRQEERIRVEEETRKKEEETLKRQEEHEKSAEIKRTKEQERRRIEQRTRMKDRQEEEEIARRKKEEHERLEEEKNRQEDQEKRRIEEEEKIKKEEEERIRIKKEAEKERTEEEARKLEVEKLIREAEKQKDNQTAMAVESPVGIPSNPFDETLSNNPFEKIPDSPAGLASNTAKVSTSQQRVQSAASLVESEPVSTDEKNPISTQRERRLAPQPPGRNPAERQAQGEQHESTPHLAQINKKSKDKDIKTVSVLPQRSVQMIAPLSMSLTDTKYTQSMTTSSSTKKTSNGAKHSKRPAPSRPCSVEGPSPEHNTALSSDGDISHKCGSEAKQFPIVYGLNPFEDDEDEIVAQDDVTISGSTGSVQWPPVVSQAADKDVASQEKIKSSKARAPPLPVTKPDSGACDPKSEAIRPVHVQEAPLHESQPVAVQSAREEAGGKKEGSPITLRRLQPVKPLNPMKQQSVSVVQGENDDKSTGILCQVQGKTKVKDTGLKGPYSQLTQDELISLVLKQDTQLSEKAKKISELEQYIDNLLVRVIEEKPSILMSLNSLKKAA